MKLSTRGRYAVMAMAEMAARERKAAQCGSSPAAGPAMSHPVSLAEIASAQQLSLAYLEQLFARLRRSGLVASARGPGGGYRLARPAAEIAIAEIVEAVEEAISTTRCEEGGPGCLATGERCLTHDLWYELGMQIRRFLGGVTLEQVVCAQVAGRAAPPLPPPQPQCGAGGAAPLPAGHGGAAAD